LLLTFVYILPVSTITLESVFSNLKRVKTYLRNRMKEVNNYFIYVSSLILKNIFRLQDQLSGLNMFSIYRGMSLTAEEVIDELGQISRQLEIFL